MMETCLWVMTRGNIFGIPLRKLLELGKKEVEDWECLSSPPFDFRLKLPEVMMRPFVFDSKLFLAGGCIEGEKVGGLYREPEPFIASSKIYQFFCDVDDKLRISEAAADSIPPPPTLVCDSFIANIAGELYLLVYNRIMVPRDAGLWVLRSGRWQRLPDPPPIHSLSFSDWCDCFVHQDKLFLQIENLDKAQLFLYVFDPRAPSWTKVEDHVTNSFALWNKNAYYFPDITLSLPHVCNCSVTLTWSLEEPPAEFEVKVKIRAMLVNNKDNSVFCYQSLDECSKAIQPASFRLGATNVNFVDLGNGMVCAVVNGYAPEYDNGVSKVLCILVFALSLAEEPDAEASGKEQRFLSVDDVLVNHVFTMKDYAEDYIEDDLHGAIIFPPKKELPLKHAFSKVGGGLKLALEAESDEMAKGQWLVTRVIHGLHFGDW